MGAAWALAFGALAVHGHAARQQNNKVRLGVHEVHGRAVLHWTDLVHKAERLHLTALQAIRIRMLQVNAVARGEGPGHVLTVEGLHVQQLVVWVGVGALRFAQRQVHNACRT